MFKLRFVDIQCKIFVNINLNEHVFSSCVSRLPIMCHVSQDLVLCMPTICLSCQLVLAIRDLVNCTIVSLACTLCRNVGLVVPGIP
jgi:hypothetical protein